MQRRILLIGLIFGLAGCVKEPERSRLVPPGEGSKAADVDGDRALTKNPRRIATH